MVVVVNANRDVVIAGLVVVVNANVEVDTAGAVVEIAIAGGAIIAGGNNIGKEQFIGVGLISTLKR